MYPSTFKKYYLNYGNLSPCHWVECAYILILLYVGSQVISKPKEIKTDYISAASKTDNCQQSLLISAASFSPHSLVLCFNISNLPPY